MANSERGIAYLERRLGKAVGASITKADIEAYADREANLGVKALSEFAELGWSILTGENVTTGRKLPFAGTFHDIAFRPGEMSVWGGINGHGKSTMILQAVGAWVNEGDSVGIASFEMQPAATLAIMARQTIGVEKPSREYYDSLLQWCTGRVYVLDRKGIVDPKYVVAAGYCMAERRGIKHYVVDNLAKVVRGEDDYNAQKQLVDELFQFAQDTGAHVHLLAHPRKGKSEDEAPGKFDIRGSGSITDAVDNVLVVWKNKKPENQRKDGDCDALLMIEKQRHGTGWEGAIALDYDPASKQYRAPGARRFAYINRRLSDQEGGE